MRFLIECLLIAAFSLTAAMVGLETKQAILIIALGAAAYYAGIAVGKKETK